MKHKKNKDGERGWDTIPHKSSQTKYQKARKVSLLNSSIDILKFDESNLLVWKVRVLKNEREYIKGRKENGKWALLQK